MNFRIGFLNKIINASHSAKTLVAAYATCQCGERRNYISYFLVQRQSSIKYAIYMQYICVLCAMLLKYRPKSSQRKCSPVQIDILCGTVATDRGKPQTCGIITSSLTAIIAVVLENKYKWAIISLVMDMSATLFVLCC